MLIEENPFRRLPSLRHMATVKTIGILLKNFDCKPILNSTLWESYPDFRRVKLLDHPTLTSLIRTLEIGVDKLSIPEVLKTDTKSFLVAMVRTTTVFLISILETIPLHTERQYWTKIVDDVIDNLHWDNIGYADVPKTLQSYVSNRKTIDFVIWNQLCIYCIEADVIRFSRTIDWNNCKEGFYSILTIYWYYKIYKTLPNREMYSPEMYIAFEKFAGYEKIHNGEDMLLAILCPFVTVSGRAPLSAIMYFRNSLKYDLCFDIVLEYSLPNYLSEDASLYLLRKVTKDTLHIIILRETMLRHLLKPPWILFIDDWISIFETVDVKCFIDFFQLIGLDRIENYCKTTVYAPFVKVWRIYFKRFSANREIMGKAFSTIITRHDSMFCELMFKGIQDHQRKLFLKEIDGFTEIIKTAIKHRHSLQHFYSEVLRDDEEKELFLAILDNEM